MEHINCRENLSAYLDGELPALERALVEAHLADCPDCRAVLGQLSSVSGLVKKHVMEPVPAALKREVLSGTPTARPWFKPVLALSAAAAAVLVVFNVTKTPQSSYSPDLNLGSRVAMDMAPEPAAPAAEAAPMEKSAGASNYSGLQAPAAAVRGAFGQAKLAARSAAPLSAGAGGSLAGAASMRKALPVSEFSGPVCVYVADPAFPNPADGAMNEAFAFLEKACPNSAQTRPGAVFIKKDGSRSAVTPRDCSYGFILFDGVRDPRVVTDPRSVSAEYRAYFGLP